MEAKSGVRGRGLWVVVVGGLVLLAVIVLRAVQASGTAEALPTVSEIREERGVPVAVAEAGRGDLAVWREFNGVVSGIRESVVRARTGEQVAEVLVSVGSRVQSGQVLLRQSGEGMEARVRQAEAAVRQVARTAERLRPLWEAGAISDQDWEAALTQLELVEADLAAAQDILLLKSPIAGVVTEVMVRTGLIPSVGDPLVRVADLSRLLVSPRVSPTDAVDLRQGQLARIAGGAAAGLEGRVRRLALQADPASRLVEVEIEFPASPLLTLGTLSAVEVLVASREAVVFVPTAAVRPDGSVWIVADGRALRREVTLGVRNRTVVEVLAGIEVGEQVVVDGASLLSDGARVRVVDTVSVS